MQQLDSSTRRQGLITSLFRQLHWLKSNEWIDFQTSCSRLLAVLVCTGLRRQTLSMNYVVLLIHRPGVDFDRRHRHH